ncbi:hypothetical protein [Rossellomorea marisflavi]|uniref:hypothetical protein n=1 Tax=Rossellomorea marisflavi TaxID=189381 RepID=UPI003513F6BE
MAKQEYVSFKESRILSITCLFLFVGGLMSVVPQESLVVLIVNSVLALIGAAIFYTLWRLHHRHSKRYYSLLSYVMIIGLSVYFAVPLLRIFYGTYVFWIGIGFLVIVISLPSIQAERIAKGILNPSKNKFGKVYMIIFVLVLVFGSFLYINAGVTQSPDALTFSIFLFALSLMFLCIAPILLLTPERMEELKRNGVGR